MKKFLALFLIIVSCIVLVSCNNGAEIYSNVNEFIFEDFLNENRVNAIYKNPNYIEGENEEFIYDETLPEEIIVVIDNETDFQKVFKEKFLDIDFEKEVVILYIFADNYSTREYFIKNIKQENQTLKITLKLEERFQINDAVPPYQRCIVIKTDKTDFTNVNVIK